MPQQYLVLGEIGSTDGPFTEEELRFFLGNGRVRSQDRIRRVSDGTYLIINDIISDAADISAVRPVASDRIRRKTSDRIKVAQEKSERVPITVQEVVPGETVSMNPVEAPADPRSPSPIPPPVANPPRTWRQSPTSGVLALVVLVGCLWWVFGDGGNMSKNDILGTWNSHAVGIGAIRGNNQQLMMVIDPKKVTFELSLQRHVSDYELELALTDVLVLKLATPHPTFGSKVAFARGQKSLLLLHGEQGIPLVQQ